MVRSGTIENSPPQLISDLSNYQQEFYRRNNARALACCLASVVTLGIFALVCYFYRILWVELVYDKCEPCHCSVVVFREKNAVVTMRYVQYFSPEGVQLQPKGQFEDTLVASEFVGLRINVGSGWWLYYDEDDKIFLRLENGPSSLNSSRLAFNKLPDGENEKIGIQLETGRNWLNKGKDDESELVGYQEVGFFTFLLYLEYILSAGIFWLFCYWQPFIRLMLTHRRCNLLAADTILTMNPPNRAKNQCRADEILGPLLNKLFYLGIVHIILLLVPIGLLAMIAFLIMLHITLRPYAVRKIKHATRDGQQVQLVTVKARQIGYFKGTSCSESAIIKYFTWQKVKYVWSGVSTAPDNSSQIVAAYCFERQTGLIANDDVDPGSLSALNHSRHQVLGVAPTISFLQSRKGHTEREAQLTRSLLGHNKMELPLTPFIVVFFREILSPFYIFQIFSVSIWIYDGYLIYAYVIIGLSALSMIWQIITIRLGERALRKTMHKSIEVEVYRTELKKTIFIDPDLLVPGDIIIIPAGGCILQCDSVILAGTCLVDEAMLTGESVPVFKFGLPPVKHGEQYQELLQIRKNERSLLFCGTRVLQANSPGSSDGKIKAVVVRTGFMTAKGELTRLILYPKPLDFEFAVDAVKFVGVMAIVAFIGMCYSIGLRVHRNEDFDKIAKRSLDIITIAVPPALPIALTIGYLMAQRRLLRRNIYCTSPSAINVAGVVDTVCMDKTGTMTETGLDFEKLLPAKDGHFVGQATPTALLDGHLLRCLVSCHSLALVDGRPVGDPIEEKMFEMAGWHIHLADVGKDFQYGTTGETFSPITVVCPPKTSMPHKAPAVGIIRQLPFSSHFQRMSVVACPINPAATTEYTGMSLYLKGAPETVVNICRVTTVPADLDIHLGALTENGFRVLGLATKRLARYRVDDILTADRDELERDLDFLGLLVFENKIKPQTRGVIEKLKMAKLRTLMLTGDNALTAVSVARQAGIIEEKDHVLMVDATGPSDQTGRKPSLDFIDVKRKFEGSDSRADAPVSQPASRARAYASQRPPTYILDMIPIAPVRSVKLVVTGASWAAIKEYFPDVVDKILMRGAVFARVNPNQKKEVIEGLQRLGFYALMCGDGANDCGALRAACTGISLSQAEASVASPFTSKIENIFCAHLLIREGRCALVTSFAIFRFMLLYAFIQFTTTFILYYSRANLSEFGFLYTDLFLATTLVFTMSFTEAYDHLVVEKPPSSLLELQPLMSIVCQGLLVALFQIVAYTYVLYGKHFWFLQFNPPDNDSENFYCFEFYSVFIVSIFQYPCIAFVLSKGIPFRKPTFTNWLFCINLALALAANIYLCIDPLPPFPQGFEYSSIANMLQLAMPPSLGYRGIILSLSVVFCLTSLLCEVIFIERPWFSNIIGKALSKMPRSKSSRKKYEILEEQLGSGNESWPPVSQSSQSGAVTLLAQERRNENIKAFYDNQGFHEEDERVENKTLPRLPPST